MFFFRKVKWECLHKLCECHALEQCHLARRQLATNARLFSTDVKMTNQNDMEHMGLEASWLRMLLLMMMTAMIIIMIMVAVYWLLVCWSIGLLCGC